MSTPPLDPRDATAELVTRLADVVVAVMRDLVERGRASPAEIEATIMRHLVPAPQGRADLVQQMLMQRVLLSLAELFPRSGHA